MLVIDGVEMVDIREAAALARRSPETVRRWAWSGRVPSVKKGRKLFVPREAVLTAPGHAAASASTGVRPSLADWARDVTRSRAVAGHATARDLVLDDRARH